MNNVQKFSFLCLILLLIAPSALAQEENIFVPMVKRIIDIGAMNLILFMLFLAIIYAILKKSKLLGESIVINAVVALVAAFLIFVYPTISGFDLLKPVSTFITQSSVLIILLLVALLAASLFYPDMSKVLGEVVKGPTMIYVLIAVLIALAIVSGLVGVIWGGITAEKPGEQTYKDVILIATSIILFIAVLYLAAGAGKG